MDDGAVIPNSDPARAWPSGISRIPFWLYQDPEVLRTEQKRIFYQAL